MKTAIGWLRLCSNQQALVSVSFCKNKGEETTIPPVLETTKEQIDQYFKGRLQNFNLPLAPIGTEFQQKVWQLVGKIEFGETTTYLEIAKQSGSEKHTRAVGLANGKNPIPIIIPCHRVIGSNGKLTGYAGGLERKRWLLLHEQKWHKGTNLLF